MVQLRLKHTFPWLGLNVIRASPVPRGAPLPLGTTLAPVMLALRSLAEPPARTRPGISRAATSTAPPTAVSTFKRMRVPPRDTCFYPGRVPAPEITDAKRTRGYLVANCPRPFAPSRNALIFTRH